MFEYKWIFLFFGFWNLKLHNTETEYTILIVCFLMFKYEQPFLFFGKLSLNNNHYYYYCST